MRFLSPGGPTLGAGGPLVSVLGALLLTGCGSDDPVTPVPAAFSAAAVAAGFDTLERALQTEGWASFAHLAGAFQLPSTPLAAVPVIPGTWLGRTFAHDGQGYVVDEERTDAPADGVRFLLYAIDEETDEPDLGVELGHADVRDIGAGIESGFELAIEAVAQSTGTVVEYTAAFELEEAHPAGAAARLFDHDGIELAGRVTDGVEELSFALVTGMVNGVEVTDLDLAAGGVSVTGVVGHDESTDIVDVDFSLLVGGDELRVTGGGAGAGFEATISLNGAALATATGLEGVEVAPAPGVELSAAQMDALRRLVALAPTLLELIHILVEPTELS